MTATAPETVDPLSAVEGLGHDGEALYRSAVRLREMAGKPLSALEVILLRNAAELIDLATAARQTAAEANGITTGRYTGARTHPAVRQALRCNAEAMRILARLGILK